MKKPPFLQAKAHLFRHSPGRTGSGVLGLALLLGLPLACSEESEPPASMNPRGPTGGNSQLPGEGGEGNVPGGAGGEGLGGEPDVDPGTVTCGDTLCGPRMQCIEVKEEFTCECLPGFSGQRCEDINECAAPASPCGENTSCVNFPGGYSCVCDSGFTSGGETCEDRDECENSASTPCDASAECENEPGGFTCTCPETSVGDGFFCKQEPACEEDSCAPGGTCREAVSGFVCECPIGRAGADSCDTVCETLELPEALSDWVRLVIGKPSGILVPDDVAHLTTLYARDLGLTDLSGLECWPGLEQLDLSFNELTGADLAVLAQLSRLTVLRLDCNPVESLSALGQHPGLRSLSVAAGGPDCPAALTDLSALSSMNALSELILDGHHLGALNLDWSDALGSLRALRTLSLAGNGLTLTDLSFLDGLPALSDLRLGDNELEGLSFLSSLPWLRRLDVSSNSIESLSPLASLSGLEVLNVKDNQIQSLVPLSSLLHLRELDVSENDVEDLGPLASLSALTFVNARENPVESLAPLLKLPELGTLIVDNVPAVCSTPLSPEQKDVLLELEQVGIWVLSTCQ